MKIKRKSTVVITKEQSGAPEGSIVTVTKILMDNGIITYAFDEGHKSADYGASGGCYRKATLKEAKFRYSRMRNPKYSDTDINIKNITR
jgi:hypothetical protein